MKKVLTIAQIRKRYDSEWVLVGDPIVDEETLELRAGQVLTHSPDRDEVHRRLLELRPKHFALRYVGKRSKDVVFAL